MVFTSPAGARDMEVVNFKWSIVAVNSNGDLVIAVFDGETGQRCVDVLTCRTTAGEALLEALSSALKSALDAKRPADDR